MEKKRYGKRINIQLKVVVRENGRTNTLFYNFPRKKECHDGIANVFFHIVNFFRVNFPKREPAIGGSFIDEWTLLRAIPRTNTPLSDDIMNYVIEGINSNKIGGKKNDFK